MKWYMKPPKDLKKWHLWFAWYPVRVVQSDLSYLWFWLEFVERCDGHAYGYKPIWIYRSK